LGNSTEILQNMANPITSDGELILRIINFFIDVFSVLEMWEIGEIQLKDYLFCWFKLAEFL
jgi:hypothetical protein